MNTMIPAPRDLPPGRHTEIRAELQRATSRRGFRFAPLVTAVAALSVIGLVAYFVPWQPQASPPVAPPLTTTTTRTSTPPSLPGVSPEQAKEIAQGCMESAGSVGVPELYNYVTTEDTKHALVMTWDSVLACTIDGPNMKYNASLASGLELDWLPGEWVVDTESGSGGGDAIYTRPVNKGKRGYEIAVGRVSPKVARVTMTSRGTTVDAVIANGTFLARILYPSTWQVPERSERPVVKAFDSSGALIGTNSPGKCYRTPQDEVITHHGTPPNPATCELAQPWP